jgi:hypothetical protein
MQLLEVTIKHLDEKRIQEQKYTELESKMREKSLERVGHNFYNGTK